MTQQIEVSGLKELRETLTRTLPDKLQGKALQGALAKAALPILRTARARAPVKTGRLRKAIYAFRDRKSTRTREGRLISVRSGKRFQKTNRDAYYWKWLEFGHGIIKRKKGGVLGRPDKGFFGREVQAVPARPFMRPAFEAKKFEALEIFRKTLSDQIVRVAKRAAARSQSRLGRSLRRSITGL